MHHAYHGFFPQFCEVGGLDKFHLYKKKCLYPQRKGLTKLLLKSGRDLMPINMLKIFLSCKEYT